MSQRNRKVVLRRVIEGVPAAADFELVETQLPEPGPGQVLVRHHFISLDPYQRPAMAGRHGGARLVSWWLKSTGLGALMPADSDLA